MNPYYGTQNAPTSILKCICMYQLISLAFISGSMLYASYLCLSPIYCITHVECFRFYMAANIDFV